MAVGVSRGLIPDADFKRQPSVSAPSETTCALIRFAVAGAIALILHKVEDIVNNKADDYFPDEESQEN